MFFQRFLSTATVRPGKLTLGLGNAVAVFVLLSILAANETVFAQNYHYRANGARRVWNVVGARDPWNGVPTGIPSRVEPDEAAPANENSARSGASDDVANAATTATRPATGIPSRLEAVDASSTQQAQHLQNAQNRPRPQRPQSASEEPSRDSGWAVSGAPAQDGGSDASNRRNVANGQIGQDGRNVANGQIGQDGQNVANGQIGRDGRNVANGQIGRDGRDGQDGRNVANAPSLRRESAAPSVAVSLPFARRATREELERWRASEKGTLVAIPRVNFLKSGNEKQPDAAAPSGIDATTGATTGAVPVRDAVEASATESVASAIRTTNVNANAADVGADEYVVFTLSNLPADEATLLRDAEDGRWDEIDLFEAALIAEGLTTRERRAPQREKFERFAAELATLTERETDPLEKTKIVYEYLHDVVLTEKYNLNCSSLVASLENGVFNCVSATALFNCFAARAGLEVAALETTGHAKSRVKFADSFLDLETTCSSWERLPDKIRAYSRPRSTPTDEEGGAVLRNVSFERRETNADADAGSTTFDAETSTPDAPLGYSYTRTRKPMREIGDVELVATIYYNVGVDFYQRERFEEAIVAYVKAARLAPNNRTILGNLKATLNNWAIQIATKDKDFERAILVAEQGLLLDPNFPEYKMNLPIFFHYWVDYLARDNRWDEAKRVEREYLKRFPKPTPQ
ncbi:MAG: tetratricopeptide repeat protein [Thermoguttaceae bacterium]|nr:tetratricopeptide repeat protein [Thermoguttaceae bacterium]